MKEEIDEIIEIEEWIDIEEEINKLIKGGGGIVGIEEWRIKKIGIIINDRVGGRERKEEMKVEEEGEDKKMIGEEMRLNIGLFLDERINVEEDIEIWKKEKKVKKSECDIRNLRS